MVFCLKNGITSHDLTLLRAQLPLHRRGMFLPMHETLTIVSPCSPSFRAVGDITEPNKIAYARKWGVEAHFPVYFGIGEDRGFGRLRFMLLHLLMARGPILFMGADTIFTNFDIAPDAYMLEGDITAAWDVHGLQSDVMYLRQELLTTNVLQDSLGRWHQGTIGNFMADSDQGSFVSVLSSQTYRQNIPVEECQKRCVVSKADKTINRYVSDWKAGDFIFHAAGVPIGEKVQQLKGKINDSQLHAAR